MMDAFFYSIKAIRELAPETRFNIKNMEPGKFDYTDIQVVEGVLPDKDLLLAKMDELYQADIVQVPLANCKTKAKELIAATDWIFLPDVSLKNMDEYLQYRASVRALLQTPVANPEWPVEPEAIWN